MRGFKGSVPPLALLNVLWNGPGGKTAAAVVTAKGVNSGEDIMSGSGGATSWLGRRKPLITAPPDEPSS